MHVTPAHRRPRRAEAGVSIVLAMLVLFVLVVVLFEVRYTASVEMDQARAFVDSARMRMLADAAFQQARSVLLMDVDQPEDEAGAGGEEDLGAGGPFGSAGGGEEGGDAGGIDGGAGSDEAASIADTIASTDSLLDEWQDSATLAPPLGQDYTLYVEVEDEDGKLNLLGLWTEDEEERDAQREIVRKLLDKAFEGTSRDLSIVDATDILDSLDDWVKGNRGSFDPVPTPKLKLTNAEEEAAEGELDTSLGLDEEPRNYPLTLGELLLIEDITPEHLSGFVEDDVFHPGLEHYLTLFSNLEVKPKPPITDEFGGSPFTQGSLFDKPSAGGGLVGPGSATGGAGEDGAADGSAPAEEEDEESYNATNDGLVNANTAPLAVLRALAPDNVPTSYLEKVIEFREEILKLKTEGALAGTDSLFDSAATPAEGEAEADDTGFGDDSESEEDIVDYVFTTPEEVVDKVEQKYHLALNLDPADKTTFTSRLTTTSQVFTIKIMVLDPVLERRSSFRGMVWRLTGEGDPTMVTLLPLEPYYDARRLKDFPDDLKDLSDNRFLEPDDPSRR